MIILLDFTMVSSNRLLDLSRKEKKKKKESERESFSNISVANRDTIFMNEKNLHTMSDATMNCTNLVCIQLKYSIPPFYQLLTR